MHIYIYLHTYAYAYICTRIHMHMHDTVYMLKHWYWDPQSIYAHEYTCTCMTPSTCWSTDTETHNLCTNIHTHTHTHVYKRIHIHIHIHMHIHIYIYVRTHTHIHIHTHTYKKITYARTQVRLDRQRGSDRARSWCRRRKLSRLFRSTQSITLGPPMLGINCTHFLRHQYPSTPHPLFPTYPRTVRGPRILGGRNFTVPHSSRQQSAPLWRSSAQLRDDPLHSCRKIGGKATVQQSCSMRARRNPSPRMIKVTVHEKREVNEKRPNTHNSSSHNHDSAAPRQHPAHLHWCGADPPSSWPTHIVGHKSNLLKLGYIFAIFAGFFVLVTNLLHVCQNPRPRVPVAQP